MEHAIRSPRDGRVTRLPFREGDLVEAGVALAEILSEEKLSAGRFASPRCVEGFAGC